MEIRAYERFLGINQDNAVRVVMLSALGDPKNVVHAYCDGGADSYLVKPIDQAMLLAVVRDTGLKI